MAFRQPQQRPQVHRQVPASRSSPAVEPAGQTAQLHRPLAESQEWILFSPAVDDQQSVTSHTSQTPRTANLSHLSDFGSLETGVQSERYRAARGDDENLTCQGTEIDDDEAEDLDSLDDGLHAFHGPASPRLDQSGGTVLPTHDGLGTFPTSYAYATNEGLQEQFWQFERYNPNRRRAQRRRSSVQKRLDAMDEDDDMHSLDKHEERRLRIEKWRLEQSRAVLEEIEKETRRRRRRMGGASGATSAVTDLESPVEAPPTTTQNESVRRASVSPTTSSDSDGKAESESFWQRITRRVIQDLMGLDETTLSVIFGEELPRDATPTQPSPLANASHSSSVAAYPGQSWETRLLERIARELGIIVHQLSEHEGAFSSYSDTQPDPVSTTKTSILPIQVPLTAETLKTRLQNSNDLNSRSEALFAPTLPKTNGPADTWLWGIEEETNPSKPLHLSSTGATQPKKQADVPGPRQDEQYWEQDLDIRMIFRYLRNRFSRSAPAPTTARLDDSVQEAEGGLLPAGWAAPAASALGTSPESLRRADLIRRHHPLVSHAASASATRRRESLLVRRQHQLLLHRRATSSSCASQSTKRTRSGGSRKYWDFPSGNGSTAGGGSMVSVGSAGYENMMGSWGEV